MIIEEKEQKNILESIIALKGSLPKKQKQLCNYIIESFKSIGPLTVKELADSANVGTSTVMRVIEALGYESYITFRKDMHYAALQSSDNAWGMMEKSFENNPLREAETLSQVWQEVNVLLANTLNSSLIENFNKTIDLMLTSKRINILGLRSSKAAADYFHHLIEEFYPKTAQLSIDSDLIFDRIVRFESDEILFLISFYPYTYRSIEAAQFCHERGHRIILVTDRLSCPIAEFASIVLKTEASARQYSIVPAMALLEAIIIELGRRTADTSIKNLKELGEILKQKKISYS